MKIFWHNKGYFVPIALISGVIVELVLLGIGYLFKYNNPVRQILGLISLLLLFLPALLNYIFTKYFVDDNVELIKSVNQEGNDIVKKDYSSFLKIKNQIWTRILFYGVIVTLLYLLIIEGFIWLN